MTIATVPARTDPEDPLGIPAMPIVEWFRMDASRRIATFLGVGAAGMVTGSFGIARLVMSAPHAALIASRSPTRGVVIWPTATLDPTTVALAVLGFAVLVGGGLVAILGLNRVLSEESYLALRVDGALLVHGDARRLVRWDDVADVRHDPTRDAIVLVREGGDEWAIERRFAGATNGEIVKKAAEVRRRALFGMYRR